MQQPSQAPASRPRPDTSSSSKPLGMNKPCLDLSKPDSGQVCPLVLRSCCTCYSNIILH